MTHSELRGEMINAIAEYAARPTNPDLSLNDFIIWLIKHWVLELDALLITCEVMTIVRDQMRERLGE